MDYERLRFAYRIGGGAWNWLPELFDASILSDECHGPGSANFTGAFVGMACQDMSGTAHPADFDCFEYREREYQRIDRMKLPNRRRGAPPLMPSRRMLRTARFS